MSSLRILSVPLMACIFSNSSKKCPRNSETQFNKTTTLQDFFRDHVGINSKVAKATDPIVIDNVEATESLGIKSRLMNTKVTGFKDVVITNISEKKDSDIVHYTLNFNMVAEGDVSIEFLKRNVTLTGDVKYEMGATGHISHPYIVKDDQSVYVGPEVIICEGHDVKSSFSQLTSPVGTEDLKKEYEKVKKEHQDKLMCEIARIVFKQAVENLRMSGTNQSS